LIDWSRLKQIEADWSPMFHQVFAHESVFPRWLQRLSYSSIQSPKGTWPAPAVRGPIVWPIGWPIGPVGWWLGVALWQLDTLWFLISIISVCNMSHMRFWELVYSIV
jgi:hypothetical protein